MQRLTEQDLETKGLIAISNALEKNDECIITVGGESTYIVMPIDQFKFYRERDTLLSSIENKEEIKKGNYTTDLDKHLRELSENL